MGRKRNGRSRQEDEFSRLSPLEKLARLQERMAGVTEDELIEALRADEATDEIDSEAAEAALAWYDQEVRRRGSVSTRMS